MRMSKLHLTQPDQHKWAAQLSSFGQEPTVLQGPDNFPSLLDSVCEATDLRTWPCDQAGSRLLWGQYL